MQHAEFMAGLITGLFIVCGVFFVRFWLRSREALFIAFAVTFFLLALGHGATAVLGLAPEERTWIYLTRLAAFVILIVAIVRKNVAR